MTGHRWFAVHTRPHAEHKAAFNLRRQGYTVYLPEHRKRRRHARRTDWIRAPFFPRYLFVRLDPEVTRWRAINSTFGVTGLVSMSDGGRPTPVPAGIVEALEARRDADGLIAVDPMARLKTGDSVRLCEGPFAEVEGIFASVDDHDRIVVLLDLMGRPVRVQVTRDSVEAVA